MKSIPAASPVITPTPVDWCADEEADLQLSELTGRYAHRVRYFAHRIERRFGLASAWHDDLVSAGYWGLLKALQNRRVDAHEHELSAYVSCRIEGSILDEARHLLGRISNQASCDPEDLEALADRGEHDPESWNSNRAEENPEHCLERSSRWKLVEESLAGLEVTQRRLLLAVAAGRSLAEIARMDGSTPSRLQGRMTRVARQVRGRTPELRRILREEM